MYNPKEQRSIIEKLRIEENSTHVNYTNLVNNCRAVHLQKSLAHTCWIFSKFLVSISISAARSKLALYTLCVCTLRSLRSFSTLSAVVLCNRSIRSLFAFAFCTRSLRLFSALSAVGLCDLSIRLLSAFAFCAFARSLGSFSTRSELAFCARYIYSVFRNIWPFQTDKNVQSVQMFWNTQYFFYFFKFYISSRNINKYALAGYYLSGKSIYYCKYRKLLHSFWSLAFFGFSGLKKRSFLPSNP